MCRQFIFALEYVRRTAYVSTVHMFLILTPPPPTHTVSPPATARGSREADVINFPVFDMAVFLTNTARYNAYDFLEDEIPVCHSPVIAFIACCSLCRHFYAFVKKKTALYQ